MISKTHRIDSLLALFSPGDHISVISHQVSDCRIHPRSPADQNEGRRNHRLRVRAMAARTLSVWIVFKSSYRSGVY